MILHFSFHYACFPGQRQEKSASEKQEFVVNEIKQDKKKKYAVYMEIFLENRETGIQFA